MRIEKIAAAIALVVVSSAACASGSGSITGVIRFTGEIVMGVCSMPASDWYHHVGRQNGQNPANIGATQLRRNTCAGIADTRAISFVTVPSKTSREAGTVIIDFN
ncbi:hypothetical protein D3C85_1451570 [compost metagenome]